MRSLPCLLAALLLFQLLAVPFAAPVTGASLTEQEDTQATETLGSAETEGDEQEDDDKAEGTPAGEEDEQEADDKAEGTPTQEEIQKIRKKACKTGEKKDRKACKQQFTKKWQQAKAKAKATGTVVSAETWREFLKTWQEAKATVMEIGPLGTVQEVQHEHLLNEGVADGAIMRRKARPSNEKTA